MSDFKLKFLKKILNQLPRETRLTTSIEIIKELATQSDAKFSDSLFSEIDNLLVFVEDKNRIKQTPTGKVKNWENESNQFSLEYSIMNPNAPWKSLMVPPIDMPGMITSEEICYYHYLAGSYTGWGEVVELGPWLGHSTMHLINALSKNSNFEHHKMHVYDDFVWRSAWMDKHYNAEDRPAKHQDFQFIFERYTQSIQEKIITYKGKFTDYDGNQSLPQVVWDGKPIEIIIVDCGRTIEANAGWLNIFSKGFVPNRTLVVMQDWRQHRERPRLFYNQTLFFTKRYPNLELIHEVIDGGLATFLYR